MVRFWFLTAVLLLLVAAGADAQYMRCGGELVGTGDIAFEVVSKCGEPAHKEAWDRQHTVRSFDPSKRRARDFTVTVHVEQWTYNFGPGTFLYVVRLEDGKVVDIRTAGFGR